MYLGKNRLCLIVLITTFICISQFITAEGTDKLIRVKIQYADLIDTAVITHSGLQLKLAIQDPALTGEVQPHVDRYSCLLQYALELIVGPDQYPHHNLIDHYPVGSEQPAWVALLRSGKICVMIDNQHHARVFLPGYNAEIAYEDNYSIIRHCLTALVPDDGSELAVDVYAYQHDYTTSTLTLFLIPYSFKSKDFPKPTGLVALNLSAINDFCNQGYELIGARLNREEGLVLYGRKGLKQTVDGKAVSIADFAVAYRATFHAGENRAYVSLDKHKDPIKAAVNFGGFLENTRIGQVVLDADKRFKTITTSFDYKSFDDMRDYTRQYVPSYLSVTERYYMNMEAFKKSAGWIGTRFWFYPDSIEVQTDNEFKYAVITKPRFLADAERSKDDFKSLKDFEKKKQLLLPPSIRMSIDHLNDNYEQYASAYQEFKELEPIARFMGLCSWLYQAKPRWLDLDAFLSVRLPAHRTPTENLQLITCSYMVFMKSQIVNEEYIKKYLKIFYITPALEKSVREYFVADTNVAKFLCIKNNKDPEKFKKYKKEAAKIFEKNANLPMKMILTSRQDVKAFAGYAARAIDYMMPPGADIYMEQLDSLDAVLKEYKKKIDGIGRNSPNYNYYVREYTKLIEQYNDIREKFEKLGVAYPIHSSISGGVNLDPEYFAVKRGMTKDKIQQLLEDLVQTLGGGVESDSLANITKDEIPDVAWKPKVDKKIQGSVYKQISAGKQQNSWVSTNENTGAWQSQARFSKNLVCEKSYSPMKKTLFVAEYAGGKMQNCILGSRVDEQNIIFTPVSLEKPAGIQEPPAWWLGQ
ncbi:hypothetical protein AMJ74_02465 [candidate division WOR_3 bacterium SM1_77]|uniref:Uncharacterized protein n=1 Tax=candidate division WOR_3 bacterium SM1_77 TaxID=1703778 RepID=A0A0S8JYZ0_UNCW3|nr:MAG: hypothetical protein AMJ74_02465 [candidate division WOR_3 bacterium SM1_77]